MITPNANAPVPLVNLPIDNIPHWHKNVPGGVVCFVLFCFLIFSVLNFEFLTIFSVLFFFGHLTKWSMENYKMCDILKTAGHRANQTKIWLVDASIT